MKRYVVVWAICGLLLGVGWLGWRNLFHGESPLPSATLNAAASSAAAVAASENSRAPATPADTASRDTIRRPALATLAANPRTAMTELPDGELRRGLAALPEAVRARALEQLAAMRMPFNDHAALRVDLDGRFYYVCAAPADVVTLARAALPDPRTMGPTPAAAAVPGAPAAAAVPISQPPVRHSRPGATRVAYLDFNGHAVTGTAWNPRYGVTTFATRAYDTDGAPSTFGDAEQAAILRIWARIAEDFAPFDIDVTTEQPAVFTTQTARILITSRVDANGVTNPEGAGAGGVAFLSVFGTTSYAALSPAFVYYDNLGNDANVAEAASHELGHNLGLFHDGTATLSYYGGHGTGETSWGPIMGTGYGRNVSQWSKGEYFNANNTQDDLAVIAGYLGYRADDAADTNGTASALTVAGNALAGAGVVERPTDADRFSFTSGAGAIAISVAPFRTASGTHGGNLDVKLELYDAAGALLAVADPPATTAAAIAANVAAGTYFLRVSPAATGTPLASVPGGYSVYGSGGAYTISGTTVPGGVIAPAFTVQPPDQSAVAGANVTFTASLTGTEPLVLEWRKVGSPVVLGGGASLVLNAVLVSAAGEYQLTATNAAGSALSRAARLSVAPAAVPPTITTQPAAQVRAAGSAAEFFVTAAGTAPLTYQWRRNGVALAGATSANLAWSTVAVADAGSYSVVVGNSVGAVTSEPALLTVNAAPVFTQQPAARAVSPGATATFSVAVNGAPAPALRWQRSTDEGVSWTNLSDATGVSGAATALLTLTNLTTASSGHRFRCVATNSVAAVASDPATLTVAVLPAVIGIASGGDTTFFLKADGTVWATGLNARGQFGDGTTLARSVPVQVADGAVAVATGYAHSLVLKADGTLWAAGANNFGQLGDGTSIDRSFYVKIASDVAAVAANTYNSAFIGRDGRLWVMGRNADGELGNGTLEWADTPVNVGAAVRAVAWGHFHLAYVTTAGELRTTGGNELGQLGDGSTTDRLTPVAVATNVRQVTAAYRATLAVKNDGTAWATGENNWSQFGDGTQTNRTTLAQVGSGVRRLASSFTHTLRLATGGQLTGSGDNRYGQLGDGTVATRATGAAVTTGPLAFVAGNQNSHWVTSDGSTWAAGKNSQGQLGDGSTLERSVPVKVFTGLPALAATATGVRATDGASSECVRVTWDHALGATGYEVWRHTANDSAGATRLEADERVNFFEDRSAVLGTTYYYWVKSAGGGGVGAFSASDSGYVISASSLPSFLQHPGSVTREAGETAQFTVAVAGGATVALQWQFSVNGGAAWTDLGDDEDFLNTRTDTLSVAHVGVDQSGWRFRCVATNANGAVASNDATLTMSPVQRPPVVTRAPAALTLTEGATANFSVEVTGIGPFTYQWRRNTAPITNATGASYARANVVLADAGSFDVIVTNGAGSTTSAAAALVVDAAAFLSPATKTVSSKSQLYAVSLSTSGAWAVTGTRPSWVIIPTPSGTGSGFLQITTTENFTGEARTGQITVNGHVHTLTQLPSDGLDNWVWRNPTTTGVDLVQVAWLGDRFVAVGTNGALQTSADGLSWTLQPTPANTGSLSDVARSPARFVVAGTAKVLTSEDGLAWVARSVGVAHHTGVVWNGSLFVLVGAGGSIRTSPDGLTWTQRTSGTTQGLRDIEWADGKFVAVGEGGTVLTSADGVTWAVQAAVGGFTGSLTAVAHNGTRWVAAGLGTKCFTSSDALAWTEQTLPISSVMWKLIWDGTQFVGGSSSGRMWTSPDGLTWTSRILPWTQELFGVAWNGQRQIVVGRGGLTLASEDRAQWTPATGVTGQMLRAVMWSGERYVAVGYTGTIVTSPDGATWTARNSGTTKFLAAVVSNGAEVVAVGESGTVLASADGAGWTPTATLPNVDFWGVCWSGSQYVAVGAGSALYTSPDARTWTARPLSTSSRLNEVIWNGAQFVAVGVEIYTSPDGVAWTRRVNPATSELSSVAWNGSQFVAMGGNGMIVRSDDGVTWTRVPFPTGYQFGALSWNGSRFLAVGSAGYSWTSSDGLDWVIRQTVPAYNLNGLAQRGDQWVAVGDWGTIITTADSQQTTAPVIFAHPQSQTVPASRAVQFSVAASGTPAPAYQWRQSGVPLAGATGATLNLVASSATAAGGYDVVVTNSAGSVTSHVASLTLVTGYAGWSLGYFDANEAANPAISGVNADPDGDGLTNLVEYALGLESKSASPGGLPEVAIGAGEWVFSYTRPADRGELAYAVEASVDLVNWSATNVTHEFVASAGGVETWRARYPLAGAANVFFRLKVTR